MKFLNNILLLVACLSLGSLAITQHHHASSCLLVEVDLAKHTQLSDVIVDGVIRYDTAAWDPKGTMIWSRYIIHVNSICKNKLPIPSQLYLYVQGGRVQGEMVKVTPSPSIRDGDKGLFFLKQHKKDPITGIFSPNGWELTLGPQSVMHYDLEHDVVKHAFGVEKDIQHFLDAHFRMNMHHQHYGYSSFYKGKKAQSNQSLQKSILSFSPTTITAGTKSVLTIRGTNFGSNQGRVRFQNANAGGGMMTGLPSDIISWTNTQIEIHVPSGAGTGSFEVVAPSGTFTSPTGLTIPYNHLNPGTNIRDYMGRMADLGGGKLSWEYSANFAANTNGMASFERALETWRCATFINWDVAAGTTTQTSQGRDGVNGVFFGQLPTGVLGVCWSYYGSCQTANGLEWYTSELDIAFSPNYTWEYGPALPGPNAFDFETVALHELGHGHQLGHIINQPAPMHASVGPGISKRTLFPASEVAGGQWVMGRSTAAFGCGIGPMVALNSSNCPLSAPVASFVAGSRQVCAGNSIQFTDQSRNATSWDWRFQGGTPATSTMQNPLVTYANAGQYDVTLIVSNAAGSDTMYRQAHVTVAPPVAVISGTASIITGNSAWLRFDFTGTPPWDLSYSDGTNTINVNGITQSPHFISVSPTATTTYTVSSVSDAQCAGVGQGSAIITVGPPPPLRKGFGLPYWNFSHQQGGQIKVLQFDTLNGPQRRDVPFGGIVRNSRTAIAMDACGEPLFSIILTDPTRSNSLFAVDMQGNVLNPGNGFNAMADFSFQLLNVPGTYNEWYIIYQRFNSSVYSAEPALYSRVRYNCGQLTILQKDIVLTDGNGNANTYTTHKAISHSTPVKPQSHWLYLCRRRPNVSATSLDRFLIDNQGITWNANTGDIQVPWWTLAIAGSPLELSWQQDKIAVQYRNQSANTIDLVIWDANQFSNAAGAYQMVTVGDLILQPVAGLFTTAAPIYQVATQNANLRYLQHVDKKIARMEFSPSGQYLYLGAGGFVTNNNAHLQYLMQIDVNSPYPYPIRLQIQTPPFGNYNATTGDGCNRGNANCNLNYRAILGIRSGYDGNLYFFKTNSDTAWVISSPDAPMPQQLIPGNIDLSTPAAPNIYIGPDAIVFPAENIDGYRYPVEGQTVPVIIGVSNCEGCIASPASPQDIEITTPGGTTVICETITKCPDTINVCIHPDSVYKLTWLQTGLFFDSAIVGGLVQQDSFVVNYSNKPTVRIGILPIICDTSIQPITLDGYPSGGVFSGPGVVGSQFFPQVAGNGAHWVVYRYTDSLSKCAGVDSIEVVVETCCTMGGLDITSSVQDITCFGDSSGMVDVLATNAIYPPLLYSVDRQNYQPNGVFQNLPAGPVTVYIQDSTGCDTSLLFNIAQAPPLLIELDSLVGISCFGQTDGRIVIDSTGGTQPIQFELNGSGTGPGTTFSQLAPGTYTIIAIDANDCRDTLEVTIPEIPGLRIVFDEIRHESCTGDGNGMISVSAQGGASTGFEISLDGINFQEEDSITGLDPGTYTLYLRDNTGCQIDTVFAILSGTKPTSEFRVSAKPCSSPMLISLENRSGGGVLYNWDFGDREELEGFEPPFVYVDEGDFDIRLIVTDANGCQDTSFQQVSVSRSVHASFSITPDITDPRFIEEAYYEFENESVHADSYRWSFGDGAISRLENPSHRYNDIGDFCVRLEVSSERGCTDDTTICGINIFQSFVHFPSAFTPNGDGINELFDVKHTGSFSSYHLAIYSRWGHKVFESFDPGLSWDGRYNGQEVPEGVYTYIFDGTIEYWDGRIQKKGTITLIR